MSNKFKGTGNLGRTPELKYINTAEGQRAVANVSIRFDRDKRLDDGEYVDNGGFWLDTAIFGHQAERVAKVLSKGNRVYAEGSLKLQQWEKDGQPFSKLVLDASYIAPDLLGIDGIQFQIKDKGNNTSQSSQSVEQATESNTPVESLDTSGEPDF